MKRVPGAVIVLCALIILSWINYSAITKLNSKIVISIDESMAAAESGDYGKAYFCMEDAQKTYLGAEAYYGAVVKHSELDEAVLSFARLFAILEVRDVDTFIEESAMLKKLFEHVGDMENFSIRNIL